MQLQQQQQQQQQQLYPKQAIIKQQISKGKNENNIIAKIVRTTEEPTKPTAMIDIRFSTATLIWS